jgi:hypothetical protein
MLQRLKIASAPTRQRGKSGRFPPAEPQDRGASQRLKPRQGMARGVRHPVAVVLLVSLVLTALGLVATPMVATATSGSGVSLVGVDPEASTGAAAIGYPASVGGGAGQLFGVTAIPGGDAWAVGSSASRTLILHWNGTAWQKVGSSFPGSLSGVAAISPSNAWAVGSNNGPSLILHWNGTAWKKMARSFSGPLYGVAAISPSNAWAVGQAYPLKTLIVHWNGTAWSHVHSPSPRIGHLSNALEGVAFSSGGTALAVGTGSNCGCGAGRTLIEKWNGHKWREVPTPTHSSSIWLFAVASLPTGRSWAVGVNGSIAYPTTTSPEILQRAGSGWKRVGVPDLRDDHGQLRGLAAVSRSNVWAVGWLSIDGTDRILIQHWNGTSWT